MTSIRPPGAPGAPSPLGPAQGADGPSPAAGTAAGAPDGAARANPTQAVLADLRAGRVGADEAVRKLTALAMDAARCPDALRPAVESRIRATLARDPLLGDLLRRMGASVPADE